MKTITHTSVKFLSVLLLTLFGCSLDEEVYTFVDANNFYRNPGEAVAAVDGIYATIDGMFEGNAVNIAELPTHVGFSNATGGPDWETLERMRYTPFTGTIDNTWNIGYQAVNRANGVLSRVEEVPEIDPDLQERLMGEAHFLRALAYFTLVRAYKNIPLRTQETTNLEDLYTSNEGTEVPVYDLIIEDLKEAEARLPLSYSGDDQGRATQGAAKALLAKVYLQRSGLGLADEYDLAAAKAQEVIASGEYALFEDFSDLWKLENENQVESIFEIQFTGGLTDNSLWSQTGVSGSANTVYEGYQGLVGDTLFFESWDPDDGRFDGTWYTTKVVRGDTIRYPDNQFAFPGTAKYKANFIEAVPERSGANVKVLRYADVLLIHSEAINESQGPVADAYLGINQVRERAGLEPLSGLDQEALRQAIRRERELELAFEGHTLFDLQRYGVDVFLEKMRVRYSYVEPHLIIMPIPQQEVDNNENLEQNPGY